MTIFDAKTEIRLKGLIKRIGLTVAPRMWERAYVRFRLKRYRAAGIAFCHIPKNGGSYVCSQLYGTNLGHIAAAQIIAELGAAGVTDVPVIAFVQDPVSRFCSSASHFFARGGEHSIWDWKEEYARIKSLSDLVDYVSGFEDAARNPIFQSQDYYLAGADDAAAACGVNFSIHPLAELDKLIGGFLQAGGGSGRLRANRSGLSAGYKQELVDNPALMQRVLDLYRDDLKYLA